MEKGEKFTNEHDLKQRQEIEDAKLPEADGDFYSTKTQQRGIEPVELPKSKEAGDIHHEIPNHPLPVKVSEKDAPKVLEALIRSKDKNQDISAVEDLMREQF